MSERILIAGIGNIFFGDDAFGCCVAQRLARQQLPEGVRVVDFGIRGLDLAYALLEDHETVILVDALPRGGEPGTLYVVEPELEQAEPGAVEPHDLTPEKVLRLARSLGGKIPRVLVVGCEPRPITDEEEMRMELSPPVQAAVEGAVGLIESLVARMQEK